MLLLYSCEFVNCDQCGNCGCDQCGTVISVVVISVVYWCEFVISVVYWCSGPVVCNCVLN